MENNVVYFTEAKAYDLAVIFHAFVHSFPGINRSDAWEAAKTIYDLYMSRPEIHAEEGPEEYAARIGEEVLKCPHLHRRHRPGIRHPDRWRIRRIHRLLQWKVLFHGRRKRLYRPRGKHSAHCALTKQEIKQEATAMYNIRVHYDNGDSITARINANVSEIVNYYLDKPMYGVDLSARARCIEFLDGPVLPFRPQETILRRVYSLSDAFMKRHNLHSRYRYTADVYDRFSPAPTAREDAAYIPGMLDRA